MYKNEKTLKFLYFVIFKYSPKIIQERIYLKTNQRLFECFWFYMDCILPDQAAQRIKEDELIKCGEYES